MNNIRCIITDDEPMARKGLQSYIEKVDFLSLTAVCEDAVQLNNILQEQDVELLFLDIEMPYLNGIELLNSLKNPPMVILTTAYEKYAIKGYELDVVDYLLKPISFERFLKAANKARSVFEKSSNCAPDYIFVKADGVMRKINLDDILFIEALENYVSIQLEKEKVVTHITMKNILSSLGNNFFQSHKSYIVNISQIDLIDGNLIGIGKHRIPIARNMRDQVMQLIAEKRI